MTANSLIISNSGLQAATIRVPDPLARSAAVGARRQPRSSPREVTRGESPPAVAKKDGGAIVDWLSFTFPAEHLHGDGVLALRNELEAATGCKYYIEETNGKYGFTTGYRFYAVRWVGATPTCVPFCEYAFGGESQQGRAYVSITGAGCSLVSDWNVVHRFLHLVQARITRVDLAVDFMNGEFDLERARAAYIDGLFKNGGRQPGANFVDDLNTGSGKTLYIGNRTNGKVTRIYEKGKQLGNPDSKWTRFETELHNRDRHIPFDIVIRPSDYWVGQHKISENLIDAAAERIKTLTSEQEITIERLRRYLRLAYGRLLHVIRLTDGDNFNAEQVFKELEMHGIPRRLEKTALHFLNTGQPAPVPIGATHAN
ncbi:MAG: replication initiation factor domain-containing protein [Burkholderiales bacterium]|jgi:phage replication initiation protein|nr:replication initiation factor domain-containing protein [Burkholderiales bacterium]